MKLPNILILIAVLFLSDYALAQIPECPCDDAELSNGLTGNEIIDIVCPGGSLGVDTGAQLEPGVIRIFLENPPSTTYLTRTNDSNNVCEINTDGVLAVTLQITDEEFQNCTIRLLEGCGLDSQPIPTLSEWGLIAMAGVLAIAGLFVIRRRKAAA